MYHMFGVVIVPDVLELKIRAQIIWKLSEFEMWLYTLSPKSFSSPKIHAVFQIHFCV